ncbi:CLUMA_CG007768, isoform A [Clunio marinus]|uniref:CLUMA_CG007768, isoform A n=1 Tax=Clunio marinus TaxID=568069 RepID=A0A1J1I1T8_9DIPT|nr:CLUMA_CG007768, isoform A [Clunio marinus]
MTKIIFITFLALIAIAYSSANSVGSQSDEIPMVEGEEAKISSCSEKWIPFSVRNAACNTWCMKVLKRPGGYCDGKTLICTCYKP